MQSLDFTINRFFMRSFKTSNMEEEEENLFVKKAGCQKGLQPINAGYRKHKH